MQIQCLEHTIEVYDVSMTKTKSHSTTITLEKKRHDKEKQIIQRTISNELDALFSTRRKIIKKIAIDKVSRKQKNDWLNQAIKNVSTNKERFNTGKITEEGYHIYPEDEIVSKTGGDTAQCPFDCTCCY